MSGSATMAVHRKGTARISDRLPGECAGQPALLSARSAFNQPMGDLT